VARRAGHDPEREGSGNPGASNVLRIAGRRAGAIVLLLDAAKGAVPTLTALLVVGRPLAAACWAAAVVGHVAPITRRFRGGKGVATAAGGGAVLYPLVSIVLATVFVVVARLGRRASVASLSIAVLLPVGVALTGRPGWEIGVAAAVAGVVVVRHAANIGRLWRGDEPRTVAAAPGSSGTVGGGGPDGYGRRIDDPSSGVTP
jgi:acyl phosphate:glycerol-3-phosphate acyltransferase